METIRSFELRVGEANAPSPVLTLTFEDYVRKRCALLQVALETETADGDALSAADLLAALADEDLPPLRSVYELLGFTYFQVCFCTWQPEVMEAAENLWDSYEEIRDKAPPA